MPGTDLTVDLALAGMATGSAAALSGLGLVVCHRTTGVLNLAQGAIAMITAYALRQTAVVWHWPLALAAPVCVLLFAPALGWTLDALVFRPLQRARADPTRTLVSTLGVFIALIGAATLLWGRAPLADTPALVPADSVGSLGGQPIRLDTVVQLAAVLALAGLTAGVGRWTRFGTEVRAVVDNRRLAELNGVDADRVASVGWAFGAFTAGLTGVLLAPLLRLDPYGLPLLVMETMAVAVAARLRGLGTAVLAGLALGVAQSELSRFHLPGSADQLLQSLTANLFVVALLAVVLLPSGASWSRSVEGPATSRRPERLGAGGRGALPALALSLLLLPLCLRGQSLHTALAFPALALILLSLTAVTGYGGQISLGQAGYAGLGALFTGWLTTGPGLPTLPALLLAVAITAPFGLLTGWPAIRRRGLALAVATFAVGTAMSRFVFQQPYATQNLDLTRHGWAAGDRAFYAAEAALLLLGLLAVHALHRGRPGRAIAAMRDHEAAAEAAGVDVPRLKLATFVAGAALAALGGGLLALGGQAFDPDAFDPVIGLVWFAAVVVLGADRPARAVLAAALLTALDGLAPSQSLSTALIGLLALLQGRFQARPGLPPALRLRLPHRPEPRPLRPTALARALLARRPRHDRPEPGPPTALPPDGPVLAAHGLSKRFGGVTAVDRAELSVPAARITALTGPNGAGKSTLFDCLAGAARPSAGRVLLSGRDVTRLPPHARSRLGLARTFQHLAVFPSLTVAENLRLGADRTPDPPATVAAVLDRLGLTRLRDHPADGLPTGTLRLVELGRALAARPRVLLLDEPAAGLDHAETAGLDELLRTLAVGDGIALLLVEHDAELVSRLADRVYTMTAGRLALAEGGRG